MPNYRAPEIYAKGVFTAWPGTPAGARLVGDGKLYNDYPFPKFALSGGTPTGATVLPRSWGSLACAYFGQKSA